MTNDVEKRWNDPRALHTAARYVVGVVVLAGLWLIAYLLLNPSSILWGMGFTAILMCGGIGAFVEAYRVYTRGGAWPIWQGAGWLLFMLMVATMGVVAV